MSTPLTDRLRGKTAKGLALEAFAASVEQRKRDQAEQIQQQRQILRAQLTAILGAVGIVYFEPSVISRWLLGQTPGDHLTQTAIIDADTPDELVFIAGP